MISTGELRKGVVIELDGDLWQILDYHHIKMGRGSAQVRIKLRSVKKGSTVERSFQAGEKWPRAQLDRRPIQFLYRDGDDFHFMESESYEQFHLTAEQLDDAVRYLKDGMTLDRISYEGETLGRGAPDHGRPARDRDGAGLRRRHRDRGSQGRHDRERPRRAGPALRLRGRHDPGRHPDRRVSDPHLTDRDSAASRGLTGRPDEPARAPTGRSRRGTPPTSACPGPPTDRPLRPPGRAVPACRMFGRCPARREPSGCGS